jgi:hypothetical protein
MATCLGDFVEMSLSRMNVVMRDVKSFSLSLYVSPRYTSVSLRFVVRVVVFPLQPFSTQQQQQQQQQKRWIDKFIVIINNSQFL